MIAFAIALLAAEPAPARAELCLAHVNVMIAEAQRETGRVAGASWFIRDWWTERLPEPGGPEALNAEQRTALELSLQARRVDDPAAWQAGLQSCVDEAIDGDALP